MTNAELKLEPSTATMSRPLTTWLGIGPASAVSVPLPSCPVSLRPHANRLQAALCSSTADSAQEYWRLTGSRLAASEPAPAAHQAALTSHDAQA